MEVNPPNGLTGPPGLTPRTNPQIPGLVVLFDGVCNLCNRSVQFIIRRDPQARFHFASLQSAVGQGLLEKFHLPDHHLSSFVLIEGERIFTRSSAALRVLKHLGGGWKLLYAFWIVPPFIRNGVYDWIARNRYRWFGRQDACWIPTPELKERFLD
ncbi:MAG TPA: thiol-disulfide oxidoreductase DCC family protein [Puia sp.]|nr:thiol-disulfide oxidoreductase DCC family protein [Puia sp.]